MSGFKQATTRCASITTTGFSLDSVSERHNEKVQKLFDYIALEGERLHITNDNVAYRLFGLLVSINTRIYYEEPSEDL